MVGDVVCGGGVMSKKDEALKLALEALEIERNVPRLGPVPTKTSKAITALREALAEQPARYATTIGEGNLSENGFEGKRAEQPAQSTAEKSELETVPANGGLLPAQQALDKMAENARELGLDYEPAQQEPFGYFKAEPFGWTDCAESDEGAVALYERPQPAQRKEDK